MLTPKEKANRLIKDENYPYILLLTVGQNVYKTMTVRCFSIGQM